MELPKLPDDNTSSTMRVEGDAGSYRLTCQDVADLSGRYLRPMMINQKRKK